MSILILAGTGCVDNINKSNSAKSKKFDPQEFANTIYPQKPTQEELREQYNEQNTPDDCFNSPLCR